MSETLSPTAQSEQQPIFNGEAVDEAVRQIHMDARVADANAAAEQAHPAYLAAREQHLKDEAEAQREWDKFGDDQPKPAEAQPETPKTVVEHDDLL